MKVTICIEGDAPAGARTRIEEYLQRLALTDPSLANAEVEIIRGADDESWVECRDDPALAITLYRELTHLLTGR